MSRKNKAPLDDRVARAAEAALAAKNFVCAIDILVGIGWLDPGALERWRRGQIDCLEQAVQANLRGSPKRCGCSGPGRPRKACSPARRTYVARTPSRQTLRFSVSGDAAIEAAYRTHWVSPELSETKRERLAEKASRAPELVVVLPLKQGMEMPSVRPRRRFPDDGGRRPGVPEMRWPRRSRVSAGRRRAASRGGRKRRAPGTLSLCISAGPAAVTSGRACWSSRMRLADAKRSVDMN